MHCWILENFSLTALPAEEFVGRSKVLGSFMCLGWSSTVCGNNTAGIEHKRLLMT